MAKKTVKRTAVRTAKKVSKRHALRRAGLGETQRLTLDLPVDVYWAFREACARERRTAVDVATELFGAWSTRRLGR